MIPPGARLEQIQLYDSASDEGKSIKAVISYEDDQGFDETVTTDSSSISITDDGIAEFSIGGTAEIWRNSGDITKILRMLMGHGDDLTYSWQTSSSDSIPGAMVGADSKLYDCSK